MVFVLMAVAVAVVVACASAVVLLVRWEGREARLRHRELRSQLVRMREGVGELAGELDDMSAHLDGVLLWASLQPLPSEEAALPQPARGRRRGLTLVRD